MNSVYHKERRRNSIVSAATVLFLKQGFEATSMSSLLGVIGGSKTTIWAYFKSKDELFGAVVEKISDEIAAEWCAVSSPQGRVNTGLSELCTLAIEFFERPNTLAAVRIVISESDSFPNLGIMAYERIIAGMLPRLSASIEHEIEAGAIVDRGKCLMSRLLLTMLQSHLMKKLLSASSGDESTACNGATIAEDFLSIFSKEATPAA